MEKKEKKKEHFFLVLIPPPPPPPREEFPRMYLEGQLSNCPGGGASLARQAHMKPSWSASAAHSPTESPASDPLPEKTHCYSVAFYSWTSGPGQPDVPWGEMKSWNMMLLWGLLARGEKKESARIKCMQSQDLVAGINNSFFLSFFYWFSLFKYFLSFCILIRHLSWRSDT